MFCGIPKCTQTRSKKSLAVASDVMLFLQETKIEDYNSTILCISLPVHHVFVVVDLFSKMIVFLWLLITFLRWRFWFPTRRTSQQRTLPSSSLNKSGYILESHKPLSQIGIVDFSAHLVDPLVTAGHQAHQIYGLPPPKNCPN
jgi:hypothetical protein